MKFSERWLREWVDIPVGSTQWTEKLTMAGLEIESISAIDGVSGVCVGEVLAAEPHPDADRLRVCTVQVSATEAPLTIVCGGANVRAGLKVPVALIGATFPNGMTIKAAKLRGVASAGMICSTTELGLSESSTGIMELPADAPLGMDINTYLQLPDTIIDVGITPNRGDCLSIQGLARETAALLHTTVTTPTISEPTTDVSDTLPVTVHNPECCPLYHGRIIRGINTTATTPLWLNERLRRGGIRAIHPIVDIMNYVMLELGQPLHAFDLNCIDTAIHVRHSNANESVTVLDGQTITLGDHALVIADAHKILAIAGIMGGADSAVKTNTSDIFIESAFFTPTAISPTSRRLPLNSDAAYRFERGVDPQLARQALQRATELVLTVAGGKAGPIITTTTPDCLPQPVTAHLRRTRVEQVLGFALPDASIENSLQRLGMQLRPHPDGWEVNIPSFRFDITQEIDLIEELARLYGYDHIPSHNIRIPATMLPISEAQLSHARIRAFWADRGYCEAITYSFVDPKLAQQLNPNAPALCLTNPISADMSCMRTSLWPGLVQAARFNLNRQQTQLRLFEIGVCFNTRAGQLEQQPHLAGIAAGTAHQPQWGLATRTYDFYDLKGDVEALLRLNNLDKNCQFIAATHPALHPGRCAQLQHNGMPIGYLGELHPQLQQDLDLPGRIYVFELRLAELLSGQIPLYATPSKFPSIQRDLAFIVAETISFAQIAATVRSNGGEALQNVQLFDIYRGEGVQNGEKSMALSLTFQLASRTLIDEEVDEAIAQIVASLTQNHQAVLRE